MVLGNAFLRCLANVFVNFLMLLALMRSFCICETNGWLFPRIKNRIDRSSLELFFNRLNLQPSDFLLVTAFDATDVNVIVFTGDGIERVYPWT